MTFRFQIKPPKVLPEDLIKWNKVLCYFSPLQHLERTQRPLLETSMILGILVEHQFFFLSLSLINFQSTVGIKK